VLVINLERSTQRREYILRHLAGHGVNARILSAVDANGIDIAELESRRIYDDQIAREKFSRSLSRAEIACTLSHLKAYQTIVDENISMAMVLEDDAMLEPGIASKISGGLSEAPPDWDILQLFHGCNEQEPLGKFLARFPSRKRMPVGSAGYLIRKAGAEKMLAHAFPVCYPADSLIGRCQRWGVVLYGFQQSVMDQNAVFPTQIYVQVSAGKRVKRAIKGSLASVAGRLAGILGRAR